MLWTFNTYTFKNRSPVSPTPSHRWKALYSTPGHANSLWKHHVTTKAPSFQNNLPLAIKTYHCALKTSLINKRLLFFFFFKSQVAKHIQRRSSVCYTSNQTNWWTGRKWLWNKNCSIINQQSAYFPPINAYTGMWVSWNLITGISLCWLARQQSLFLLHLHELWQTTR